MILLKLNILFELSLKLNYSKINLLTPIEYN